MRKFKHTVFLLLLVSVLLTAINSVALAQPNQGSPRKIVVFQENFVNEAAQSVLLENFDTVKIKHLRSINAMAVYLPPKAEKAIKNLSEVLRIDNDLVIRAIVKPDKPGKPKPDPEPDPDPSPAQELPWGIDRIDAELAWDTTVGATIKVAILDTGIDLDHPDLANNIKGNVNLINPRKSGNDDNGHGTHVAGTVAAVDNEIGVVGAGHKISLYAVKVLDRKGNGWLSDLIEGLDWCIDRNMQVINMSLGSLGDNQSFHDAIDRAYQMGIVIVAAAGNNGENGGAMIYPAKYPQTIAISAIDENDKLAYFSSYGPEVDLTAPGVNIYSTYKDSGYRELNGTSMATPHVTAVAALVLTTPVGPYDLDSDGIWDPAEVKDKLTETAEDISLAPQQQGFGLVDAYLAAQ